MLFLSRVHQDNQDSIEAAEFQLEGSMYGIIAGNFHLYTVIRTSCQYEWHSYWGISIYLAASSLTFPAKNVLSLQILAGCKFSVGILNWEDVPKL